MKGPKQTIKGLEAEAVARNDEVDDRLGGLETSIEELKVDVSTKFTEILKAINRPVSISKDGTHADELYKHEDEHDIMFKEGRLEDDVELIEQSHGNVFTMEFKNKAEQMRFDKELIEVMISQSGQSFPDATFEISVNGQSAIICRGQYQWLPRNYVEVLLRAKNSNYGNIERPNIATGIKEVQNPETKSLRYPLQVRRDKNPKGAAWLERVVNERSA